MIRGRRRRRASATSFDGGTALVLGRFGGRVATVFRFAFGDVGVASTFRVEDRLRVGDEPGAGFLAPATRPVLAAVLVFLVFTALVDVPAEDDGGGGSLTPGAVDRGVDRRDEGLIDGPAIPTRR